MMHGPLEITEEHGKESKNHSTIWGHTTTTLTTWEEFGAMSRCSKPGLEIHGPGWCHRYPMVADLSRIHVWQWFTVKSTTLISYVLAIFLLIHGRSSRSLELNNNLGWFIFMAGFFRMNLYMGTSLEVMISFQLFAGLVSRGQMWCMRRLLQIPWWILGSKRQFFVSRGWTTKTTV